VLEYLRDLDSLADWLSGHFALCVASYTCGKGGGGLLDRLRLLARRLYFGYLNNYTEEGLVALFARHGWACERRESWTDQRIFLFSQRGALSPSPALPAPSTEERP